MRERLARSVAAASRNLDLSREKFETTIGRFLFGFTPWYRSKGAEASERMQNEFPRTDCIVCRGRGRVDKYTGRFN